MNRQILRWVLAVVLCLPTATWVALAAAPQTPKPRPRTAPPAAKPAPPAKPKPAPAPKPQAPAAKPTPAPAPKPAGLAVQHKEVGCIVAGKHPKLDACFAPQENLARARVYFRAGGTPHWYFVEMKPDQPCLSGILLKPKKSMVGKTLDLYVEALGRDLETARTAEYSAKIVTGSGECAKDVPVAAWVPKASVTVGATAGAPALPVGFAGGGLSALAAGGIAAGGAGLIGGATLVATGGGDGGTPTPATPTPATPTPATPTPATPTPETPTPPPATFNAVFEINPDPPTGDEPLNVTFRMCSSTGVDLRYKVEYDLDIPGYEYTASCQVIHKYTFASALRAMPVLTIAPGKFAARMTVTDMGQSPPQSQSRDYVITVRDVPPPGVAETNKAAAPRRLAWASQLDVPGGSGQIVVNGRSAVFARPGRSDSVVSGTSGVNRFEAQLVEGGGPGTWRFEFTQTASLRPGSLRVLAGSVLQTTADAIVFQLAGRAGERIVFTLETDR